MSSQPESLSQEMINQIVILWPEKKNYAAIARETGLSHTTVKKYVWKYYGEQRR